MKLLSTERNGNKAAVSPLEALTHEMITLPEQCSGQSEAAFRTAKATAIVLAELVADMHARKKISDHDLLRLLPNHKRVD